MSTMTKKHYTQLVRALSYTYNSIQNDEAFDIYLNFVGLVDEIVEICVADNDNFKPELFKKLIYGNKEYE